MYNQHQTIKIKLFFFIIYKGACKTTLQKKNTHLPILQITLLDMRSCTGSVCSRGMCGIEPGKERLALTQYMTMTHDIADICLGDSWQCHQATVVMHNIFTNNEKFVAKKFIYTQMERP